MKHLANLVTQAVNATGHMAAAESWTRERSLSLPLNDKVNGEERVCFFMVAKVNKVLQSPIL